MQAFKTRFQKAAAFFVLDQTVLASYRVNLHCAFRVVSELHATVVQCELALLLYWWWSCSDEASKLDERRQWLDAELENILSKKQAMEALQEELKKREAILKEREQMAKDKSRLEMKKLRSSQVLSKV